MCDLRSHPNSNSRAGSQNLFGVASSSSNEGTKICKFSPEQVTRTLFTQCENSLKCVRGQCPTHHSDCTIGQKADSCTSPRGISSTHASRSFEGSPRHVRSCHQCSRASRLTDIGTSVSCQLHAMPAQHHRKCPYMRTQSERTNKAYTEAWLRRKCAARSPAQPNFALSA